jgi:hypothetical protein
MPEPGWMPEQEKQIHDPGSPRLHSGYAASDTAGA